MARVFRAVDWDSYKMEMRNPHVRLEPEEDEITVVDQAPDALVQAGILPDKRYDQEKFLAHRESVREKFEIPWTAITPRLQRLIYAVNAIARPATVIAAGIFCGNTFVSNVAAAVGPGAVYDAERLVGIEIVPEEAARAERNLRTLDGGKTEIVAADAVGYVADFPGQIDLLYLDADGAGGRGKGVYLDILEAGLDRMPPGSLSLAHNSVNSAERLQHYLAFVRDSEKMKASVNVVLDGEGLEVSAR
jgi:predicted O-methyltransferase YrrM